MHLLFVGGSNLVIKKGFTSFLDHYLIHFGGIDAVRTENISIPGTMSMYGASNLMRVPLAEDYDHIFVEYAINDYGMFKRNPALWRATFELLLLELGRRYPRRPKTVIVLGRRDWRFRQIQAALQEAMRELAAAHGFDVLDIDTLVQSPVMEGQVFRELYFDGSHYKPPLVTNYIAAVCALHIVAKRHAGARAAEAFPAPGYTLGYFDFTQAAVGTGTIEAFRSQRYEAVSRQIDAGQGLDFEVPGLPCGISFIAACDVGSVLLDVDGQRSILHMLHRESPPAGKYRFLIRHNPFYWVDYTSPDIDIPEKSRVRLRLIDRNDPEWDEAVVRESFAMVEAQPGNPDARACLLGLDYLSRRPPLSGPGPRTIEHGVRP